MRIVLTAAAILMTSATLSPVFADQPEAPSAAPDTQASTATTTPEKAERPPSPGDTWVIRVQPRVWFVAPEGDLKIPSSGGGGQTVDLNALDQDKPNISPYGEINIQADEWLFSFSGANFEGDSSRNAGSAFQLGDVAVASGDAFRTSLNISTFNLLAGYKVWQHNFDDPRENREAPIANIFRLWVVGGARIANFAFDIQSGGSSDSIDQTWVDIVGGVRAEAQILSDFSVDAELTVGGLTGSTSLDLSVGLTWRPVDWVGAQFGYRLMRINREDGAGNQEFNLDGGLAGLFAGVVFRF